VAWKTKQPVRLIYMGGTDVPHVVAYLINAGLVPHTYLNVGLNMPLPAEAYQSDMPNVIFAETPVKLGYRYLEQPPDGYGPVYGFRDKLGNVLGYAMTNSPEIALEWKAGFSSGWSSLTGTPVRGILVVLMIGILLIATLELRTRVRLPQLSIERGSKVEEESTDLASIQGDDFVIEFRFRIRRPPRQRNQP
jgi:hypothetical protein